MSQTIAAQEIRSERCVVSRGQWASTFHRPDPDAEEPRPACTQYQSDDRKDYREVGVRAIASHYSPCQNPACFGASDPRQTQICVGGVADRPVRIQTFQAAVVAAVYGETPITRSEIRDLLAVDEGRRGSLRRGLSDARDAGWLVWDDSDREYRAGPLARDLGGDQR